MDNTAILEKQNTTTEGLVVPFEKKTESVKKSKEETEEEVFRSQFLSAGKKQFDKENEKHIGSIRIPGFLKTSIFLNGGFQPGTYAFPSETSIGKTALMQNFLEQVMEVDDVYTMLFGLEMVKNDYIYRGASSLSYKAHLSNPDSKCYTFSEIGQYADKYDERLGEWMYVPFKEYKKYTDDFHELYGDKMIFPNTNNGKIRVSDVKKEIIMFQKYVPDKRIVVVIDYLQILSPENENSQEDPLKRVSVELQNISLELGIPILFPTSVPKAANGTAKNESSISGSNTASFSASYIMPYEWLGVTYTNKNKKRDVLEEKRHCNERGYRVMWLSPQKARTSKNGADGVFFKYYPAYNYVEETTYEDIKGEYGYLFAAEKNPDKNDEKTKNTRHPGYKDSIDLDEDSPPFRKISS